ncbi:tellurite resistance TerB family protein [Reichenbachiella versicolor]|uniref:tellurite resistance TerB family protein n=1 Tax=Reichenbachiella versicolor TaxID=1821036 RepID=UPI000D6E95DA|nr:TerB family tellurite resistance protein [Reichenbachiella versicolor]
MISDLILEVESRVRETREKRYENQPNGYELGMQLLFATQEHVSALKDIDSQEKLISEKVIDHLATEILQCGIDYFLTTKDNPNFSEANALEVLNSAKSLTNNSQIKQRVDENVQGIADWIRTQAYRYNQNKLYNFSRIMLNTAFAFMTCDGHIHKKEIDLIRKITTENELFKGINIDVELDALIMGINAMGLEFLKDYFKMVDSAELTEHEELQLAEMAIKTLLADQRLDYNEKKFFKIFRSLLNVTDKQIKDYVPDIADEFFERDIFSHSYLSQLFDDYFGNMSIPSFRKLNQREDIGVS